MCCEPVVIKHKCYDQTYCSTIRSNFVSQKASCGWHDRYCSRLHMCTTSNCAPARILAKQASVLLQEMIADDLLADKRHYSRSGMIPWIRAPLLFSHGRARSAAAVRLVPVTEQANDGVHRELVLQQLCKALQSQR